MLIPVVASEYSEEDWRAIAGFLLYFRAGILRALESVSDPSTRAMPGWRDRQIQYYQDAESVTRWLLSFTPYPVQKWELWDGKSYVPRPRLGDTGSLSRFVQNDPAWMGSPADSESASP